MFLENLVPVLCTFLSLGMLKKRKFCLLLMCPPSPTSSSICWHYYPSIHSFLFMRSCTIFILFLRPAPPKKSEPFFLYFIDPCFSSIHTSHPGSLRQEVLQLQLSAKVPLKGNPPDPHPSPTLVLYPAQSLSVSPWILPCCMQQTQQPLVLDPLCFPHLKGFVFSFPHA